MSELPDAPSSLSAPGGGVQPFGRFRGAVGDVSTAAWDRGAEWPRRLQRKSWIYAGAYDEDLVVGYAVADVGYLGTAFLYVYDRARRLRVEETLEIPFGWREGFHPSLRGAWSFGLGGKRWRIDPAGDGLRLRYDGRRLSCDLRIPSLDGGMTSIAPSARRPFNHTFKRLNLPVELSVRVDERHFERSLPHGAAIDFTLGYPPRDTHWNWACLQGTTADGRPFGLNLVAFFNDELENALWLGDRLIPLGRSAFTVGSPADLAPWTIRVDELDLALTFRPEGARQDRKNLGLLKHDFIQPFGRFEGSFRDGAEVVKVSGYGVVEDHTSHW
jgi:hypothetical protein